MILMEGPILLLPRNVDERRERRRWMALVVLCFAQLMNALDATIVNVALPAIQADLGFSQADLTWVVNGYLIAFGSFLLTAGRLGDLVGRKRVFLAGLLLFTAASVLCALAQDPALLIAARFLQGLGAAVSASVTIALIVIEFPGPAERAKAMSVYMFVAVGGGSIGLLLGGALTEAISWHWIFLINVPIGLLTLVAGRALIDRDEGIGLRGGVDVLGSLLVTSALMVGIYAIVTSGEHGWGSARTLGLGAAAIALLAAFLAYEARVANPIMPLRILRLGGLMASSAVRVLLVCGMYAAFFVGALYLQHVLGYDALGTGFAFLPMTVVVGALSLGVTARLMGRFGPQRMTVAGLLATGAGLVLFATVGEQTSYFPHVFAAFALVGLGAGTAFLPLLTIAVAQAPRADAGLVSGIVNVSTQISGAIGVALLGAVSAARTDALAADGRAPLEALLGGYRLAFVVAAGCVAAGVVVALLVMRPPPD